MAEQVNDQEFDSNPCDGYDSDDLDELADMHMSEIFHHPQEENRTVENCELVCKSTDDSRSKIEHGDSSCNDLHAEASSISMVQNLPALQKDSVLSDQNAENNKEMEDSTTTFEMCQQDKMEKSVPSGKFYSIIIYLY